MRIFSLEFIRQNLNVDQVHFVPMKKGYLFKFPKAVGPFIVNTRQDTQEVEKLLNDMCLLQVVEWAYDPHQIISKRRLENGYSAFVHESRPETEKLANGGLQNTRGTEIETHSITEKGFKRVREEIMDLDEEESEAAKRTKLQDAMSSAQPGLVIQLGETEGAPASPSSKEPIHDQVPLIQSMFSQIVEKNQKMKLNMEAQVESRVTPEQTRLLSAMDLEKSQLKIAFYHPT